MLTNNAVCWVENFQLISNIRTPKCKIKNLLRMPFFKLVGNQITISLPENESQYTSLQTSIENLQTQVCLPPWIMSISLSKNFQREINSEMTATSTFLTEHKNRKQNLYLFPFVYSIITKSTQQKLVNILL